MRKHNPLLFYCHWLFFSMSSFFFVKISNPQHPPYPVHQFFGAYCTFLAFILIRILAAVTAGMLIRGKNNLIYPKW